MTRYMRAAVVLLVIGLGATSVSAQTIGSGFLDSANDTVCTSPIGQSVSVSFQITGTYSGTITFQGTSGQTMTSVLAANLATGATGSTTTSTGMFGVTNFGYTQLCATMTSYASGGANVRITKGYGSGGAGSGGGGSVTQGTDPWIVRGSQAFADAIGSTFQTTRVCDADSCISVNAGSAAISGNVGQSGTWTVQPGNTANTTAWRMEGLFSANGAASGANRVPTLPAIAVSSNPSLTNTFNSALYTNLTGGLMTTLQQPDGTAVTLANDPCGSTTKTSVPINEATTGNNQIIALSGSTVIYICSVDITAEATVDAQLVYGTGSDCDTGETDITGTYAFSTTTGLLGINKGSGGYYVYKTAAGNALCIELGGNVQVNGSVTYVQQ